MAGEFDFIDWIRSHRQASPLVELSIGDDLAVLKWPGNELLLVGADQVIDGVHFDSAIHSPEQIGRKAINRNLSDCAAMGCLPAAALMTAALPRNMSWDWAKRMYLGARGAAEEFGCAIVGGDTATWEGKLVVSVTILGRDGRVRPVSRAGAKAGDEIFVTGALGGSILGRHIEFTPRVEIGRRLARIASSMIDLSDGLSSDLPHLCRASGVGAVIESSRIPIHPDAVELAQQGKGSPLDHALNDGEDYELLYTTAHLEAAEGTRIGRVIDQPGVWLELVDKTLQPLVARGWQHATEQQAEED
jgi:thiamine-monophosphate kinase